MLTTTQIFAEKQIATALPLPNPASFDRKGSFLSSSPSALLASLQTNTFQVRNEPTGAFMSLIKKFDVKKHLSKTDTSV